MLSPMHNSGVVGLIAAWREGDTVSAIIPLTRYLSNGLFALRQFDRPDAEIFLLAALTAETSLITLLPPEEMGRALNESNCDHVKAPMEA